MTSSSASMASFCVCSESKHCSIQSRTSILARVSGSASRDAASPSCSGTTLSTSPFAHPAPLLLQRACGIDYSFPAATPTRIRRGLSPALEKRLHGRGKHLVLRLTTQTHEKNAGVVRDRQTLEYAFVLVSFSQTLKRSMSASIFFRASVSGCLSLTWSPVIHDLICSRNLCHSAQGRVHAVRILDFPPPATAARR